MPILAYLALLCAYYMRPASSRDMKGVAAAVHIKSDHHFNGLNPASCSLRAEHVCLLGFKTALG